MLDEREEGTTWVPHLKTWVPQILLSADEAAKKMGISRSSFYRLKKEGRLPQPAYQQIREVYWRYEDIPSLTDKEIQYLRDRESGTAG